MKDELSSLDNIINTFNTIKEDSFSDLYYKKVSRNVDNIVSLIDCNPQTKILDLACGTGGETIVLAERGYNMTGIDCTPEMLNIAKKWSNEKSVKVNWVLGDIRDFCYTNEFDYILLRDVIFGVCDNEFEDKLILNNISKSLKPNGRCLLEVYNKEFAIVHGIENRKDTIYDKNNGRFLFSDKDFPIKSMKLYSHEEWHEMLSENHLKIIKMFGWNWQGDPDPQPWRADYIVAEKNLINI